MIEAVRKHTPAISKPKPKPTNFRQTQAEEYVAMPSSGEGWHACQRTTMLAYWVLDNEYESWSLAVLPSAEDFQEVALALKKMSELCAGAAGRLIAAEIRTAQRGARRTAAKAN